MKADPTSVDKAAVAAGRPRDPRIDAAILRATTDLLVEIGYSNLTMAAVAERAGTTKTALYRRWSSKAELVHEAAFPAAPTAIETPPGDFARRHPRDDRRGQGCVHQPGGAGGATRSDRRHDRRPRTECAGDGPLHRRVRRRADAVGRRACAAARCTPTSIPTGSSRSSAVPRCCGCCCGPTTNSTTTGSTQTTAIVAHGVIA